MISSMKSSRRVDVVQAILVAPQKEILLIKRTVDYPLIQGGYWALFGGAIEPGESPQQAMARELKEELNLEVGTIGEPFDVDPYDIPGKQHGTQNTFICSIERDLSKLSLTEGAGFALFTEEEIRTLKVSPHDLSYIKKYFGERHD